MDKNSMTNPTESTYCIPGSGGNYLGDGSAKWPAMHDGQMLDLGDGS